MRRFSIATIALSAALATTSFAGVAQARDDHRGDGYRHNDDRGHPADRHRHRHGRHGPNIYLGLGDGYYDNSGVWIGVGDRRHRHHRDYD